MRLSTVAYGLASALVALAGCADEERASDNEARDRDATVAESKVDASLDARIAPTHDAARDDAAVARDAAQVDAAQNDGGQDAGFAAEGGDELNAGCTPDFELKLEDTGAKGQLFVKAVGDDPKAFVTEIGRHVCRILYRKPSELLDITKLTLIIRDEEGVAWKSGSGNEITVMISTQHLNNINKAGGNAAVAEEIRGILYHEMTHMYQYDDRANPERATANEGKYARLGNVIEGVADFVRLRAGHAPGRMPSKNGRWDDEGYTKPAYFLLWADTQYPGFAYRMNLSMRAGDGKSWEPSWSFPELANGKTEAELMSDFKAAACCNGSTQTCCK